MFKHIAIGTAVLAAALAVVPTAAQAQDFYHDRDFRFEQHRREEAREWREHLRRERERRFFEHRFERRYDRY